MGQVFEQNSLTDLMDQLRDWLFIALSADCNIYEEGEQRKQLLAFHGQLLILVEALFIINKKEETEKKLSETDKTILLTQEQIANPMEVIATFFEKFSMIYILRELDDWLEASICFSGTPPEDMHELQALWTYRNILCLVKSANRLLGL